MIKNPFDCREIEKAVASARRMSPSLPEDLLEKYLQRGMTVTAVRADLFEKVTGPTEGSAKASMLRVAAEFFPKART